MVGLLIIFIEDICIPIGVGCLLALARQELMVENMLFFSASDLFARAWVKYAHFLMKEARILSAPFLAPLLALSTTYYLYPMSDFHRMEAVLISYGIYLLYRGAMVFVRPSIELFFFGPTTRLPIDEEH